MEITRKVNIAIYCCNITVIITDDMIKTLRKYYKKYKITDDLEGFYAGLFLSTNKNPSPYYIFLDSKDLSINTVSHESFHASCAILRDRGVNICGEDEEPQAYLISYIIEEIMKLIIGLNINLRDGANKSRTDK